MAKTFYYLLKEARPRQWIKNLVVFSAIFFTGEFFNINVLIITLKAFVVFCLASSSMYIFNDFKDLEKDKLHPFKKNRPLASGKLNLKTALVFSIVCLLISLWLANTLGLSFLIATICFYALQFTY
ncbi:UbiA family prenyltransferase, partial [Candidatus Microgenomates bacterium]|nr:UbiA family prenyltransferase [Candidatus Microgenomates bacterium]